MHLVSDAAVPAHVRNDAHPAFGWMAKSLENDMYEKWASENFDKEEEYDNDGDKIITYTGYKSILPYFRYTMIPRITV